MSPRGARFQRGSGHRPEVFRPRLRAWRRKQHAQGGPWAPPKPVGNLSSRTESLGLVSTIEHCFGNLGRSEWFQPERQTPENSLCKYK